MRPVGLLGPQSALLFGGICWGRNEGLSTEHQQPWGRGGNLWVLGETQARALGRRGGSRRGGAKPSQHSQQLCRGAQSSRKVKPMTLKECKKEEKADREFQKKFKVSRKERSLFPLIFPLAVQEGAVQRGCVGQEQAVPSRPPH